MACKAFKPAQPASITFGPGINAAAPPRATAPIALMSLPKRAARSIPDSFSMVLNSLVQFLLCLNSYFRDTISVMAKRKMTRRKSATKQTEPESVFFLKLVFYMIIGSQWVRIENFPEWSIPIPLGLIVGLVFASHDHFAIDRKIEFALLLIASFVSFWLPMGVIIEL